MSLQLWSSPGVLLVPCPPRCSAACVSTGAGCAAKTFLDLLLAIFGFVGF